MFPRRTLLLLILLLMTGFLLVWLTLREMHQADQQVQRLMIAQAESLTDVIAESGLHGLQLYARWEDEVAERLLDNARWIATEDSIHVLTSSQLARLAAVNHLHRINLFDRRGNKIASSVLEPHHEEKPKHQPIDFIRPVLEGRTQSLRIGFKEARFGEGSRFAVAVARPGGGAVVVNVLADSLRAVRAMVQPGHLFQMMGQANGLAYLAVQDETGLLAASPGVSQLSTLADDHELRRLVDGEDLVVREGSFGDGHVLEVSRIIALPSARAAVLRIGLETTALDAAREQLRHRALVRLIVFVLTAALAIGLLLAWQRHTVLDRDIQRARAELRESEEEARRSEKLAAMGALASGVAHEVRNPLNTIHMIAQQMGRDPEIGESLRTSAAHVRDESERIEKIVQQFLEFARPRPPRRERLDLGELLRSVAATQQAAFDIAGVKLAVEVESLEAHLDAELMTSIIDNLLRNAREASPRGGLVQLRARGEGPDVVLEVEDEGPGIPEELRRKIFDVYFTTKASGTGLGLSLVSQMTSTLGGRIRLADALDGVGGTRFVVRLPREGNG